MQLAAYDILGHRSEKVFGVERSLPNLSSCVKARRPRRPRPSPQCSANTPCRKTQKRRQPVQVSVALTAPSTESRRGLGAVYKKTASSQSRARIARRRPSCRFISNPAVGGRAILQARSPLRVLGADRRATTYGQFGLGFRVLGFRALGF